jgi:hypothetical protein
MVKTLSDFLGLLFKPINDFLSSRSGAAPAAQGGNVLDPGLVRLDDREWLGFSTPAKTVVAEKDGIIRLDDREAFGFTAPPNGVLKKKLDEKLYADSDKVWAIPPGELTRLPDFVVGGWPTKLEPLRRPVLSKSKPSGAAPIPLLINEVRKPLSLEEAAWRASA